MPGSGCGHLGVRRLKGGPKLAPGPDPELREHVAQVPLDGAWAEEQARTDLRVREPVARELGDLTFLCGEVVAGAGDPPAHLLAGGEELVAAAFGERLHAHRREQVP